MENSFSLHELATLSGLSPRAVRFYIQRGLLPPPAGRGPGRHYGPSHLDTLIRLRTLQAQGLSLDEIALSMTREPDAPPRETRAQPESWARVILAPGLELHVQAGRFRLAPSWLAQVQAALAPLLSPQKADPSAPEPHSTKENKT